MANRNIDESLRKPRRARGTPFYTSRNFYALGVIAAGGVFWGLYELWPAARKLKHAQLHEGKFGTPASVETTFLEKSISTTNASYAHLLKELRDRADAREDALYEDESKPQPCTPKISKYFSKVKEEEEEVDAESPYKFVVSKVRSIEFDDSANDDDFKSPPTKMVQLKPPKAVPKVAKKNLPVRKTSKGKNPMRRMLEDNFNSSTGMNGEQLQMALALSESSYVAENPGDSEKSRDAQEKAKLFKQALEKFGLRCGGGKSNRFDAPKPRNPPKKSRYRFVTPILKLRTDEERQSLLVSKLTLLLTRNARFEQNCLKTTTDAAARNLSRTVHSDLLREHLCAGFENFHLSSLNAEELTEERFYVKNLNLTRPEARTCGCLLKNWTRIPGRDVSPSRGTDEENITETTTSVAKNWTSMMDNGGGFEDGAIGEAIETNKEICQSIKSESEHQAIEPESENLTKESRTNSQNEDAKKGYRTDSEDLETFAFSNLTDLLRPSADETEQATERTRCITPDLFDETEDDSSQSLLSPFKISPALKNVTQRKKVELPNKSSNIVVVDLTYSTEEEEENADYQEKRSFFVPKKWNLEIEETSHVQHDKICVVNSRSGTSNFDITQQVETKNANEEHIEENDVVEETPNFDCDATIILNEAERNAHVFNTRCSENEDVTSDGDVETPDDLGFDDDCNDKVTERSFADDQDVSKCEATSSPNMNRTEDLNVTDYVLHILNNRNSSILRGSSSGNNSSIRTELFPSRETIDDDELNYSSALSKSLLLKRKVSYELSSSSDSEVDDYENRTSMKSTGSSGKSASSESSPEKAKSVRIESPEPNTNATANLLNDSLNNILESSVFDKFTTPNCSKVVIKTDNVTPMPDYDEMDTPKVTEALDKFGLKPLKRKKGAEFLKYIYEATHPLVEAKVVSSDDESAVKVVKKRRIDDVRNLAEMDMRADAEANDEGIIISDEMHAEIEEMQQHSTEPIEILGEKLTPADDEELVFERSQSRRVPSCRVPLHIVWHNFVSANPNVRENILLYEPLQLEVLHVMLKQQGYKFNIQDLLTFLDKKCITIRTNPTGSSSRRKQKKTF